MSWNKIQYSLVGLFSEDPRRESIYQDLPKHEAFQPLEDDADDDSDGGDSDGGDSDDAAISVDERKEEGSSEILVHERGETAVPG